MKKLFYFNAQIIKFMWLAVVITIASSVASGATFTVTKTADTNDGVCNADCSLREAVAAVNAAVTPDNIINFDSSVFNTPQTLPLTTDNIVVNSNQNLSIVGTGANLVSIDCGTYFTVGIGSQARVSIANLRITGNPNGSSGRIYNSAGGFLSLSNVVVTNAADGSPGAGNGGTMIVDNSSFTNNFPGSGIYNVPGGNLTITNSNISNNGGGIANDRGGVLNVSSSTISSNNGGSAIFNTEGTVNLNNVTISNNNRTNGFGNDGGAIWSWREGVNAAVVNITNCTISGNTVSGQNSDGGAIIQMGSAMTITNTVISGNRSLNGNGGAIHARTPITIINSTITGNQAATDGGGIYTLSTINLTNSTISNNTANRGGGIAKELPSTEAAANARNTIIGDNIAFNSAPDFSGILISQGYNLIENISGITITGTTTGNILGQDPQLMPLRNNSGTTSTVALLPTSPAVDSADPNIFPATDQRGINRPQDGDINGSVLPDIGAYERQVFTFTVTKTDDTNDGICDSDCSLREAIAAALASPEYDIAVVFDTSVFASPQTITLTLGELKLSNGGTLAIYGTGSNLLTISGGNQSRVFVLGSASGASISGVTVTGGNGVGEINSGFGGGINNDFGYLAITNSIITGNTANNGGGISSMKGTLFVTDSSVANNAGTLNGGGIFNQTISASTIRNSVINNNTSNGGVDNRGMLTVISSTVKNNSTKSGGGGIKNFSGATANITGSTINGNNTTANSANGGGIYNFGTMNLTSTTVHGNSANLFGAGGGIFNSSVLNIINSTISSNSSVNGGGINNSSGGSLSVRNSIIADNTATTSAPDFSGTMSSQGYNLIENIAGATITGTLTGNITGIDPLLLPLRSNGGFTQTQALRLTSPGLDKGSAVTGLTTDQRGQPRPFNFPSIPNATGGNGSDIGAYERQTSDITPAVPFDFEGDGKTDLSIFRPSNGEWWYLRSSDGGNYAAQFGNSSDKLVPGDYTGDEKTDIAIWRPSSGEWFILRSEDGSYYSYPFGTSGDIPAVGDFDGDGKVDSAVFRPSDTNWYIRRSSDGGFTIRQFGANGDIPVVADYDGDGKSDIAIWRASVGEWWIQRSSNSSVEAFQFGNSSDKPVQGDYTGDGKADVAIWRPSTGEWFILRSEDFSYYSYPFGTTGDVPAPGDYDGDGKFDATVFRPNGSTWYVQRTTAGILIQNFGTTGDVPVPNAFVP